MFAKLLSAAALLAATVAAHAAPKQYSFSAPSTNPLSFYVEADDDSIISLSVIDPVFTLADLTYTPSTAWINFYDGIAGETYTVELELAAGSKAKFGAYDTVTNQPINLLANSPVDVNTLPAPVPEPQAVALALAGVAVAGVAARRRRAA